MKLIVLFVASSVLLQAQTFSPVELLTLQRPLTAEEMDTVAGGIHQALDGITLRFSPDRTRADREFLMGRAGLPHMIRHAASSERVAGVTTEAGTMRVLSVPDRLVKLIEYTGVPARRCNGAPAAGEMVIEYVMNSSTQLWTATARESGPGDIAMAHPLEMLRTPINLTSGETRLVGNRQARAIVSKSTDEPLLTGDPAPNPAEFVLVQSLWIDTTSLLPLRWQASQRQAIIGAFDFVYESLDIQRPPGADVPKCIS